jgi:hypothetical protein
MVAYIGCDYIGSKFHQQFRPTAGCSIRHILFLLFACTLGLSFPAKTVIVEHIAKSTGTGDLFRKT